MMGFILNMFRIWWVKARGQDSLGCQQSLSWLRSPLANVKTSPDFLLRSCGPAAAFLQMFKGKKQERRGEGSVSKSPFRTAFITVNRIAHGILVIHVNLFRWWWLQLKGRVTVSSSA